MINMETNPYAEEFDKACEYLRLTLSYLMSHKLPPTPPNFRVVYESISGGNVDLREKLDDAVKKPGGANSEDIWQLYQKNFTQTDEDLNAFRDEFRDIVTNLHGKVGKSGEGISEYADELDQFSELLDSSDSIADMAGEVRKVIKDTRATEKAHRALGEELANTVKEVASLRNELDQVRQESLTDALTGISNRKAFDNTIEEAMQEASETGEPLCVLIADIDHFKQFNDTHGHLVGDKVLRFVAGTLKRCLKGKDMVARFGGEEFVVILPDTGLDGAKVVAEQIRKAVSSGKLKDQGSGESYGRLTISLGASKYIDGDATKDLLKRADDALYRAKDLGRDRVEIAA